MKDKHSLGHSPVSLLRLRDIVGDRRRGVRGLLPICASSWWSGVASGRYPQPIKLSARTTCWHADEVLALIGKHRDQQKAAPVMAARIFTSSIPAGRAHARSCEAFEQGGLRCADSVVSATALTDSNPTTLATDVASTARRSS
jgi:prophage regulatory protein